MYPYFSPKHFFEIALLTKSSSEDKFDMNALETAIFEIFPFN